MPINPLPLVGDTPNLRVWAEKLVNYLRGLETAVETPGPKVIQLEHAKGGAKAAVDGLVMWSAAEGAPIVSVGGQWYALTLGVTPIDPGA